MTTYCRSLCAFIFRQHRRVLAPIIPQAVLLAAVRRTRHRVEQCEELVRLAYDEEVARG